MYKTYLIFATIWSEVSVERSTFTSASRFRIELYWTCVIHWFFLCRDRLHKKVTLKLFFILALLLSVLCFVYSIHLATFVHKEKKKSFFLEKKNHIMRLFSLSLDRVNNHAYPRVPFENFRYCRVFWMLSSPCHSVKSVKWNIVYR